LFNGSVVYHNVVKNVAVIIVLCVIQKFVIHEQQ